MRAFLPFTFGASALALATGSQNANVKPFQIDIPQKSIARMKSLVENYRLPKSGFLGSGWEFGAPTAWLSALKQEWLSDFNWKEQEREINSYRQFTATIENVTVHFVHEKSKHANSIPVILLHGWPGSFLEFLPVIKPLTQLGSNPQGDQVSFDVIVPSLPGFAFSSLPSPTWQTKDTARILNNLMVDVLGYETYTTYGTDWGCDPAYYLYSDYSSTVKASLFSFLPFYPPTLAQAEAENVTLDEFEKFALSRAEEWSKTGNAYFLEQTTKPNTIGLALQDSPMGQLSWIGEKLVAWSDPQFGVSPSTWSNNTILSWVSLYYLSESFFSAEWIYGANPNGFRASYDIGKVPTTPMAMSNYKYNVGGWPKAYASKVGNLTFYTENDRGGHFPGIDNPEALISDLRQLAGYYLRR
ncbi:alpha/beta-hydrolase [Atractiella rhizophila]|nr:alpha/beta-hydrolase [Atractiella rhizophila]